MALFENFSGSGNSTSRAMELSSGLRILRIFLVLLCECSLVVPDSSRKPIARRS